MRSVEFLFFNLLYSEYYTTALNVPQKLVKRKKKKKLVKRLHNISLNACFHSFIY